jgi:hypothetical protein
MKNRILFALFPVALLSVAAKGGGCGGEEPIVGDDASTAPLPASDAAVADGQPPPPSDCPIPIPATSPINAYITGTPAGSTPSDFTVSATGSAGDKVSLAFVAVLSDGTLSFDGTGESDETYQIVVDYKGSEVFEGTVDWSVAGCGFTANIDLSTVPTSDAAVADVQSPPPSGDCPIPIPATSPINVYITGTPTASTPSEFAVSATGSAGDEVSLAFVAALSDGTLSFDGTGESNETYQIVVDYKGSNVFEVNPVGWSVAGCGFSENIDLATDAHTP